MRKVFFAVIFLMAGTAVSAQKFEPEIVKFETVDSLQPPAKQQVLFVGSSSFRLWSDFAERFKGYAVINRGFGGARLTDVTHYAHRIIIPYRPSKVFIYAGDNDIGANQSSAEVFDHFMELFNLLTAGLPGTHFYFISVKPSPRRWKFKTQLEELNNKVSAFIKQQHCNWTYIDVYHPMLAEDGLPKADLFRPDKIHLNSKGYDIWEKLIKEHL